VVRCVAYRVLGELSCVVLTAAQLGLPACARIALLLQQLHGRTTDRFLPCLQPIHPDPCVFRGWLLPSGTILCVDPAFHDVAGWLPAELIGKSFSSLGSSPEELEK
jgi:hypothetical protein